MSAPLYFICCHRVFPNVVGDIQMDSFAMCVTLLHI